MADKEATVYVVDVGASMRTKRHRRDENDLTWAMSYVWDKIATTVSTGRKTLCAGLLAFRTDETKNDLASQDDDSYNHISVIQGLSQILMPHIREMRDTIDLSSTNEGDAISAIVVAIEMINKFCKKLKYIRKIILLTNGEGPCSSEGISDIASKIIEDGIQLIVLGADFDDLEYGFKEEDKSEIKDQNEKVLKQLTDQCGGVFGTLDQAVSELGIPRVKTVRPVHSFRGQMTLGNPKVYATAMSIDIERYPQTMVAKAPTASNFVIKSSSAAEEDVAMADGGFDLEGEREDLSSTTNNRTYKIKDDDAPGGLREVERDNLSKGYEYGRTVVPISKSDEDVTKMETTAGMEILGFVPAAKFKRYMDMSRSNIIIAQRTNDKAVVAMSSFINALYELDSYAVARLVTKADKDPIIVILGWYNLNEYECLYEVELPFNEDVRSYKFPPLDRVETIAGKLLKEHRNLPNDQVLSAMDEFVDKMDISKYDLDDEGNPTEYLPLDEIYSPVLHRLNQVIRHRAVHPSGTPPAPNEILLRPSKRPKDLAEKAEPALKKLREAADVKKVPPKTLSRKNFRGRKRETPLSGLDISALLSTTRKPESSNISPDNAIPEFCQALEAAESVAETRAAVGQLSTIIEDWIRHSLGDAQYGRAIEAVRVMREYCVELEDPHPYNEWMKSFKKKILDGELGGDRREFWRGLRGVKLGLIEKRLCAESSIGEEEAKEFLQIK